MSNPFAELMGNPASGDNFIGRKDLLRDLEERVAGHGSVNIVGLSRMGKTSLVTQCFLLKDRFRWWVTEQRSVPVFISLDTQLDSPSLWWAIALEIRATLMEVEMLGVVDKEILHTWMNELLGINGIPSADDRFARLKTLLGTILKVADLRLILIMDEFDSAQRYQYSDLTLSRFRSLSTLQASLVTCSRRHPSTMAKKVSGMKYFRNVCSVLFVGLFTQDDMKAYWDHFNPATAFLAPDDFLQYRNLMDRYVGRHPYLMNIMNSEVFRNDADLLRKWVGSRSPQDRMEIERHIRVEVHTVFEEQIYYLHEQELQDTAVRLVVGGMGKPDSDIRDSLLRYQFIRAVNSEEKREVFGYDLGYREGNARYVCFSDFSSHQMVDMFDPPMEGFDLLKETENLLRQLVRSHMADFEEDNPFGLVYDENGYVHERWEKPFLRQVRATIQNLPISANKKTDYLDQLQKDFDEILSVWDKRYNNDFEPSMESKIDIVSSSTLGGLWNVFIRWQWQPFYADILADKVKYRTNSSLWYKEVFEPVLLWRNAVNHFRDEEWKESSVAASQDKCRLICRSIEDWMKRKM